MGLFFEGEGSREGAWGLGSVLYYIKGASWCLVCIDRLPSK